MTSKRIAAISLAAVAIAAAFTLSARARTRAAAAPRPAALPHVTLAQVKAVKSAQREEITGSLRPARALRLGFEVGGRLSQVLVRKGTQVAAGQVIAQLDAELADAQVLQAEAAVEAAEAQAAMAADTAQRQGELQQSGSVSEWQGKSSSTQAAAALAQSKAAKAQLAQARAARRRHELQAPFAGVVTEAPDQIGAIVGPGTPLFTIETLDPLILELTVSESARALLASALAVHVEAVGGTAVTDRAHIRAIVPSADPSTRRIPIEIAVPNPAGEFTAHTLARAVVSLGAEKESLALPASALSSEGGDHVFVVAGDAVHRIAVEVTDRGAEQVLVRASEPFQRVVDYPSPDLREGARVAVQ